MLTTIRMLITAVVSLGITTALAQGPAPQAAKPQAPPLTVQMVKPGVYFLAGGAGANTGIIAGAKEAVVIDAKMTADGAKAMLAEAQKLTQNPVKRVILTHSDGDHVNGLAGFPSGIEVIAHANCRAEMEEALKSPNAPALQPYLPGVTTTGDKKLDIEGIRVELLHFGRAHTSGDLVVYLPDQKIAFIGDLLFIGRDPLIHLPKHGTSVGLIQTLNKLLALDADTFLSGHAAPAGKNEIRGMLSSLEEKQAKVKGLIAQGQTLDDIKKDFGIAAGGRPTLIDAIYRSLTEQ